MTKNKEKEFERVLKALANKRRLAIVVYLKHKKEAAVTDIAEHLNLSFKATSKHISILVAAGILEKEQRSKLMISSITHNLPEVAHQILILL